MHPSSNFFFLRWKRKNDAVIISRGWQSAILCYHYAVPEGYRRLIKAMKQANVKSNTAYKKFLGILMVRGIN